MKMRHDTEGIEKVNGTALIPHPHSACIQQCGGCDECGCVMLLPEGIHTSRQSVI